MSIPNCRQENLASMDPPQDTATNVAPNNEELDASTSLGRNLDSHSGSGSLDCILGVGRESDEVREIESPTLKLSRRRWLVLLAMGIFGLSLSISGNTSPILSLILKLLDLREDKYIYINQVFDYFMAPMVIPIAWFVDNYGIKVAIYTASILYVLNCSMHVLLYSTTLTGWREYRMFYYIMARFISSQIMPMFFMLPLKVSETWFSSSERSVAWTVMISQLEVGVCITSFLYPRIMKTLKQIEILAYINIGTAITSTFVCFACITTATPKHPPNERAANDDKLQGIPWRESLRRITTNKNIVLHLAHSSIFQCCLMSVSNVLQVVLIAAGHSEIFAGNFMSINAIVSIIMLIVMSTFVHKINDIGMACKLASCFQAILYVLYLIALILKAPGWAIIIISIVLTICKCWTTPNFTNVTAHLASGVVSQATIVGFSIIITIILMTVIQLTFAFMIKMSEHATDYGNSLIFIGVVCALNEVIYQMFFHVKVNPEEIIADQGGRAIVNNS